MKQWLADLMTESAASRRCWLADEDALQSDVLLPDVYSSFCDNTTRDLLERFSKFWHLEHLLELYSVLYQISPGDINKVDLILLCICKFAPLKVCDMAIRCWCLQCTHNHHWITLRRSGVIPVRSFVMDCGGNDMRETFCVCSTVSDLWWSPFLCFVISALTAYTYLTIFDLFRWVFCSEGTSSVTSAVFPKCCTNQFTDRQRQKLNVKDDQCRPNASVTHDP